MSYGLGVDLGTTFTAAAVARDGGVEMATLGDHTDAVPSVVLIRADGTVLTGGAAERRAAAEPDRVARSVKRRFGDPVPVILGGVPYTATALIAHQLRAVAGLVSGREGGRPAMVTLTHPANWGPYKRELFAQVPGLAGLGEVRMLTEPEAAAAHYARSDHLDPGALVAVYDLGGGTFDATVLRTAEHGFDILGRPEGIEGLGGLDFDEAVFTHVDRALDGAVSRLDPADPRATSAAIRLRRECVTAKETLSADTETTIAVLLPGLQTEVRLTRGEFEKMIRPAIDATIASLRRALHSARIDPRQLHTVLLVGGSSRIPLIAHLVSAELGRPTSVDTHPKHAIALGAAAVAAETAGDGAAGTAAAAPVRFPPPPAGQAGPAGPSAPAPRTAAAAAPALAPTLAAAPALAAPAGNRHGSLRRRRLLIVSGLLLAALAGGGTAATRALSSPAPTTSHPPAPTTSPAHPAAHPSATATPTPTPTPTSSGTSGTNRGPATTARILQAIKFTSSPPSPAAVGGTYLVAASGGGSGEPVSFSIDSGSSAVCSVSGGTVTFNQPGSCAIDANQGGNAQYQSAPQAQQTVTVARIQQAIKFTSSPPSPAAVGGTYLVAASGGGSGEPVSFSIDSGSSAVCSVSGGTVTFNQPGSCAIDANQGGNAQYQSAPQAQQTVTVAPIQQAIKFTSSPPSPAAVGGTYLVAASGGGSGEPVSFSIDSGSSAVCSVSGGTVTFNQPGSCAIDANQGGNAQYQSAPQAQQTVTVSP